MISVQVLVENLQKKLQKRMNTKRIFFFGTIIYLAGIVILSMSTWPYRRPHGYHPSRTKRIYLATSKFYSRWRPDLSQLEKCPKRCVYTRDLDTADAVVVHMWDVYPWMWFHQFSFNRPRQVYVLYGLESEARALWFPSALDDVINWTATYRQDSDIVVPYYSLLPRENQTEAAVRNMAAGKSKMAFLLTSHCATSSGRAEFTRALQAHVDVDVFGSCGVPCPGDCSLETLGKKYKFYLSFENSKCRDYITEKFWRNGLANNMVPVVLGTSKQDYQKVAPPSSFIHVDDFRTVEELAAHLKLVDSNDTLYNQFFDWKRHYRVEFDMNLGCRLCTALYNQSKMSRMKTYRHLGLFWNATSHCSGAGIKYSDTRLGRLKKYFYYLFGIH